VIGGLIGIVLPLIPQLGLGIAAAILVAWSVWTIAGVRAPAAEPEPG
jgi:hypothetical protein